MNLITYLKRISGKRLIAVGVTALIMIVVLLTYGRPVLADLLGQSVLQVEDFASVDLQSITINGYQQIYFMSGKQRVNLTSGHVNHTNPFGRGRFVVWQTEVNGAPQIELYDVAADKRIPLTRTGTHQNPKVSAAGRVVWEQWVEDRWQVMYYDGSLQHRITEGDVAVRPDILGDNIIFSSQDNSGRWLAKKYHIDTKTTEVIKEGDEAAYPYFEGVEVRYGFSN